MHITSVIFDTCTSSIMEVLGSVVFVAFYISQLRLKQWDEISQVVESCNAQMHVPMTTRN